MERKNVYLLVGILVLLSLTSLSAQFGSDDSNTDFGFDDKKIEAGDTFINETNLNQTFINETAEVNTTQFDSNNPITIKSSWLTSFIESISKWTDYFTISEIQNDYYNKTEVNDLIEVRDFAVDVTTSNGNFTFTTP